MSQSQNIVEVELKTGRKSRGIATGNNAAWLCPCGRAQPLLGRSGSAEGVSDVDCPDCGRKYFVSDRGPVLKVVEVG